MAQQLSDPTPGASQSKRTTAETGSTFGGKDELLGRVVGSYRLEERLGGGAMASVYLATDLQSGQQVALKLLLPGADAAMRERFRREVETVRQLDFPNIVRTIEVSAFGSGALAYIAMELVQGESLGQLLDRSGQLSMVDSCALLVPIARALAYAHEQGVVHRDVKPSNILLRRSTWGDPNAVRIAAIDTPVVPLLSDFGIALVLDAPELTSAGRTIGTPAYMAPEQCADSREIDGRADIYAVGAVLFRCLIGRPLFVGNTTQILHAHVYDPVSIPDDNMRLLSPLVVEILQLALAKNPGDRYEDASWLAEDLAVAAGQRARSPARKSVSGEATATMASLPATAPTKTTSHILVAAPTPKNERLDRSMQSSATMEVLPEEDPVIPLIPPRRARVPLKRMGQRRSGNWAASVITTLVAMIALVTAFILWPQQSIPDPTPDSMPAAPIEQTATTAFASPTNAVAVALASSTPTATVTATEAPSPSSTASSTVSPVATDTAVATPTATATVQPTATEALPTRLPITPSASLEPAEALSVAMDALDQRQWATALEYLDQFRNGNPAYSPDSVAQLLGESYLVMAAVNNQRSAYDSTVKLLATAQSVLTGYPIFDQLVLLSQASEAVLTANAENPVNSDQRQSALENLQQVHLTFASQFANSGNACQAVEHVAAAKVISDSVTVRAMEAQYTRQCAEFQQQQSQQKFLASLEGELFYSAQVGTALEKSNVYRRPVAINAPSQLLIASARYPVRQWSGSLLSYYSMSATASGIYGFDLNKNVDSAERGRAIAQQFAEDGRDAPTSWSVEGDRLVFASTRETDRRSRLFLGYSTSAPTTALLQTSATWPAWRPLKAESTVDWIVYSGTNSEGNEPGLWLATSNGVRFARISDNGDDIAPVWSADGRLIFFMNLSRSGNWDIYSIAVGDTPQLAQPTLVASSPANDVMPAVSPDGKAVAFMSDRGGSWQIWVAPLEGGLSSGLDSELNGGEAILLGNIEGNIPDPTKHSMQWVK